jgi:hypothetical protein
MAVKSRLISGQLMGNSVLLPEEKPYTLVLFGGILRRGSRSWRVAVVRDEECRAVVGKSETKYHSEDLVVFGRIILK